MFNYFTFTKSILFRYIDISRLEDISTFSWLFLLFFIGITQLALGYEVAKILWDINIVKLLIPIISIIIGIQIYMLYGAVLGSLMISKLNMKSILSINFLFIALMYISIYAVSLIEYKLFFNNEKNMLYGFIGLMEYLPTSIFEWMFRE